MPKRLFAAVTLAAGLGIAAPAQATNITVNFGLSAARHAPTGVACPVSVPAGSDGVVVLEAAKTKHCIESYETVTHPTLGRYVQCIDRVCGAPGEALFLTYWAFYVNGQYSDVGVDLYQAAAGDEVVFAYETWLVCFLPNAC
jgi:hypothetical protein